MVDSGFGLVGESMAQVLALEKVVEWVAVLAQQWAQLLGEV